MEFPAFECIRIRQKWNISAAREQWGLFLLGSFWYLSRFNFDYRVLCTLLLIRNCHGTPRLSLLKKLMMNWHHGLTTSTLLVIVAPERLPKPLLGSSDTSHYACSFFLLTMSKRLFTIIGVLQKVLKALLGEGLRLRSWHFPPLLLNFRVKKNE